MTTFSPIIAGCMTWGVWGKDLSATKMADLIELYLDLGIDTFDHADIYGGYTTEAAFGEAFSQSGIARDRVKLISKCGIQYPSEARPLEIKHYDYSAGHIRLSVENSLRHLQTDYLDLLLLHRPSPLMRPGEIADTVTRLMDEGKVRDFGLSNFTPSQTDLIAKHIPVSHNQIQFSLTHWQPMTDGSLDHMQTHGITPMAWSPLGNVFKEDAEQELRIRAMLVELMAKYEVPGDILLLAWTLKHPAGVIPVCGTTTPQRIQELMKAPQVNLELEDWFRLWVESRGSKVP